ncbi:MAG: stalk domain-containing protein [Peptostreptococcaceae bacterium]|nr:stalk domain-containing protein [Peptostreptococcaceae bacterium]
MRNTVQKIFFLLSLFVLMISGSVFAEENDSHFRIEINQKPISVTGFLTEKEMAFLPFRGIGEHLGFEFHWDPKTRIVTAKNGSRTIELQSGSKKAKINNKIVTLYRPAQIYNGHLMIPLSFSAECFSSSIRWNPHKRLFSMEVDRVPAVYNDVLRETALLFEEIQDPHNYPIFQSGAYIRPDYPGSVNQEPSTAILQEGEFTYVFIGYGMRPSGGYSAEIRDVWVNEKKEIIVDSYLSSAPPGALVTTALTYPTVYLRFENKENLPVRILMDPDKRSDAALR